MPKIICGFCYKRKKDYLIGNGSFGLCSECARKIHMSDGNCCFNAKAPLDYLISPFYYEGAIKKSLHNFKFRGQFAYADIYAQFITKAILDIPELKYFDFACAVPLSHKRMIERGYNQSEIIARKVSNIIGMKYKEPIIRIKDTKKQSELNILQRIENMKDAFDCTENLADRKVILFDDIYTHGITASEAAKALKSAGVSHIVCVTVAKTKTKER